MHNTLSEIIEGLLQQPWVLVHAHVNAITKLLGSVEVSGGDGVNWRTARFTNDSITYVEGQPVVIRPMGNAPADPVIKYLTSKGFVRVSLDVIARYAVFDRREEVIKEDYCVDLGNYTSIMAQLWYNTVVDVDESWSNLTYVMLYPRYSMGDSHGRPTE